MEKIVSAVLANRRFQKGMNLRTSTVYDIDDFEIETMQKWVANMKEALDTAGNNPTLLEGENKDTKLYVLSYASFSCLDYQIFSDTLGVYPTKEDAIAALIMNVGDDIADGDDENDWEVSEMDAEYSNDYSDEYKTYHIKELKA